MKRLLIIAFVVLFAVQLSGTPTFWRCYFSSGYFWHLTGKAHCELEAWRFIFRGFK